MTYQQIKNLLVNTKKCPDGHSIAACASCAADAIGRLYANKCWYCHNARITRSLKLYFENGMNLVHLVCDQCAEALHTERVTFIKSEDQI